MDNINNHSKIEEKLHKAYQKESRSWTGFFIRNFRFTYLIVLIVVILGLVSYASLPKEADPEVNVPYAVISTIYPGSNPSDVEELITNKIEDKIKNVSNLKKFDSSSGEGFSSIFVEFNAEVDIEESVNDLKDAVDLAKPELPDNANDPVVSKVNFSDTPIVTYALTGDYSDQELKDFASVIKDELETVAGISRAEIIGGVEREFQVLLDQSKMFNFGIGIDQVRSAILRSNISLPVGSIDIDNINYNIRVAGKFTEIGDLNSVVVATFNDSPVLLSDLALIKDGFKEKRTEARLALAGEDSRNAISVQIFKESGGNIINIVEKAGEKIDEMIEGELIPQDLRAEKINDISVFIKRDLGTLGWSGLQTFILINIILLLVLSFRGALITALSVPIAFLMAFIFLKLQGMTLNGMVLFSLVLSLGLMVDNAIIIVEGIDEYVKKHKKSIYEAAILSVWNFKWPIISGTMTTVAAFAPMFLISGIMGEYLSVLPKTIIVTLLSSLFTAIVIIPTLTTRFVKKISDNGEAAKPRMKFLSFSKYIKKLQLVYVSFLRTILPNKVKRRKLIAFFWVLFIVVMIIPFSGLMKVEMFGDMDFDYFYVNVELPAGSNLEATSDKTREVENIVSQLPELDNFVVSLGRNVNLNDSSSGLHKSNIIVNLVSDKARKKKSFEIVDGLRSQLATIQGARITIDELSAGPPTGAPIEVRIFSHDLDQLSKTAIDVKKYFDNQEGVVNAKINIEETAGEFVFSIDKNKADFYNLSPASIASTLRNVVFGAEVSNVNVSGEDVDIVLKYQKDNFKTPDDLQDILIFNPGGTAVSLSQVASVKLEPALLSIGHRDGERFVKVSANIEAGVNLANVLKEFEDKRLELSKEKDMKIVVGGEVEDIEKSFKETFLSMILSVILIACILVLQFNSFRQPLIIIFSLPLAIIGVIIGLNVTGQAFSFLSFIGIVALSGIVVNDAIVLIDRINKNLSDGVEFEQAIISAGVSRMQPIFLTSLTTIAGIFPLIYASEMWKGFSITVISGLIFSTVLTLIVMPVMYYGFCRKKYQ